MKTPADIRVARLKEMLFESPHESVYAILDGASIPGLVKKLEESPEEHACLYRGEMPEDLIAAAPHLVQLRRAAPLTDWILTEGWGNHWGVFFMSIAGLEPLRRHLRGFLRVRNHTGEILYFRYYDPRVLPLYLPTCNASEIKTVYGPIRAFLSENEAGDAVLMEYHPVKIQPAVQPFA